MARGVLHLAPGLSLPLDAVTRTFGIFGQRGTGKSSTGAVLIEQSVRLGGRAVLLDPTGVHFGLTREGTEPGLPGVVLGGEHADAPLEPHAGGLVAEFVVGSDYPLVVLDMKLLRKHQRQHFAMELLEALYHDNRDPLLVVFDEAAQFAPQQMREGGEVPRLLGAVEDLVKLGRSRGLGAVMIEQRIATLNANVREQIETMIAHRLVGPLDRKALKEWIAANGEPEREAEAMALVPKLDAGEALVWSPSFLKFFGRVAMNRATTFDSRATPEVGKARKKLTARAPVDLDGLRVRMAATIEEAERNDPKVLRSKLAVAERKLADVSAQLSELQAWADELGRSGGESAAEEVVNVYMLAKRYVGFSCDLVDEVRALGAQNGKPVLDEEMLRLLFDHVRAVENAADRTTEVYEKLREVMYPLASNVKDALDRHTLTQSRPAVPSRLNATTRRQPEREVISPTAPRVARPVPEAAHDRGASGGASTSLTGPEQRVLDAVYWYEALGIMQPTRIMVGFIAGYRVSKKGGGTFSNVLSALKNTEVPLIDYPGTGVVALTEAGRALANDPGIEATNRGVQEAVLARLDGPEQRTLRILIDRWPNPLSRIDLGTEAGYTVTAKGGGTFSNVLSRLRTLGVIDYPGTGLAVATEVLFPLG